MGEEPPRVSLVLPTAQQDDSSTVVVRRLSTPFHGLPSVVDYDPDTGYITFGELIQPPPTIVHPRRYKEPVMPIVDPMPGTCRHNYCWTIRRRMYGLSVEETPIGLPWSSGLLKHLPGHVKYKYPIHKSYKPLPKIKKRRRSLTPHQQDRRKHICGAVGEMIHFYKIVMLAGSIIRAAREELYDPEEEENQEEGDDGKDKGAPSEASKTEMEPTKNEEPIPVDQDVVVGLVGDAAGDQSESALKPENIETAEGGGEEVVKPEIIEPTEAGDQSESALKPDNIEPAETEGVPEAVIEGNEEPQPKEAGDTDIAAN